MKTPRKKLGTLRERKRKKLFRMILLCAFLFVLVFSFFVYLSRRPSLLINEVHIAGGSLIEEKEIQSFVNNELGTNYAYVFPKKSVFWYPKEELKSKLLGKFLSILEVDARLVNVNTLLLQIKERKPFALYCGATQRKDAEKECFYMDEKGFVFSDAPVFSEGVYPVYYGQMDGAPVGQSILPTKQFESSSHFASLVKTLGLKALYLLKESENSLELILADGGKILFDASSDEAKMINNLDMLFKDSTLKIKNEDGSLNVDYIDLRFGNKVFYK